jgi:hypothetical protein
MNKLHVGFNKDIELPKGGFLLIADEVPNIKRARVFDPLRHSFNPLKDITYRKAREIADILYTVSPQGENTLTVRNGKRALLKMLLDGPKVLDTLPRDYGKADVGPLEALATVDDILVSPVLRRVLCNPTNFSFNPNSKILARIDRTELGDFDALVLGLLLMAHFKGQIVVPDFGFYGRDGHVSLIREGRLIVGCNFLGELPPKLRQAALLIKDKVASGTNAADAEELAQYAGLVPHTTGHKDFVDGAMEFRSVT